MNSDDISKKIDELYIELTKQLTNAERTTGHRAMLSLMQAIELAFKARTAYDVYLRGTSTFDKHR